MAQLATTTTVGVSLACDKQWTTRTSRSEISRTMAKPRRGIRGYVGEKVLTFPTYPIFKPISISASWSYYIRNPSQNPQQSGGSGRWSVTSGARIALRRLIRSCGDMVPAEFAKYKHRVKFSSPSGQDGVFFPCPLKEQDAIAAIKALEGCAVAAIADYRWPWRKNPQRKELGEIVVDLNKSACFLMSAYLVTVGENGKGDPKVKEMIENTDKNDAQSDLYRRMSANMYKTKDGRYYHIHGSLEASAVIESLGLPARDPSKKEYNEIKATYGAAVGNFTVAELEEKNRKAKGAGIEPIPWEKFKDSKHGRVLCAEPPFSLESHLKNSGGKPGERIFSLAEFKAGGPAQQIYGRVLSDIKVLEMCRVIAGPTIGRSLAAHGALVTKVTSPELPDVPFFQADVNTGKHTVHLHLKLHGNNKDDEAQELEERRRVQKDKEVFMNLLREADIIVDGYRYGALDGLGYGPDVLEQIAKDRGYGFVYVAEDCFGGIGQPDAALAGRRGWQQIADCATGVAHAQGEFMHPEKSEPAPVIPPFPMSDYGTGALGCIAALAGLYRRATEGGTWICRTSLCQYDIFLMGLGTLPPEEQAELRREHRGTNSKFFELNYDDSVDEVGKRALHSLGVVAGHLFEEDLMCEAESKYFGYRDGKTGKREGAVVKWPKEAITVGDLIIGHVRPARNNGDDDPTWDQDKWEVDEKLAAQIGLPKGHPEYVLASA